MNRGGALGRVLAPFHQARCILRVTAAVTALAALAVMFAAAPGAGAARGHFPIPQCRWASAARLDRTFGVNLRGTTSKWSWSIAPVLTCSHRERRASIAAANQPVVTVQFRELQRFTVPAGFTFVPGLGSCIRRVSCPAAKGPRAAWLYTRRTGVGPSSFISTVQLRVEAGLNAIIIQISNPYGPLGVRHPVGAVEHLARRLLRHFHYK